MPSPRKHHVRHARDHPPGTPQPTPCRIWQGTLSTGYGVHHWQPNGSAVYAHRWVVAQIHGWDAIEGEEVMHLCDNPPCFRYDHLEIGPHAKNMRMMGDRGRSVPGPGVPRKLGPEAEEIRQRLAAGETLDELAVEYGVSRSTIHNIRHRAFY